MESESVRSKHILLEARSSRTVSRVFATSESWNTLRFHYNRKGEQELNDAGVAALMDVEADAEKLATRHLISTRCATCGGFRQIGNP